MIALYMIALLASGALRAEPLMLQVGRVGEVSAPETGPAEPPLPGNVAGTNPVGDPRYTRLGTDVVGVFCKQFGLEFRALNLPPGSTALVEVRLDHPLWTRPDGVSGTRELNLSTVTPDRWTYVGYTLEEEWSLVPGPWTFTISQGPRVLATTTFNVSVEPGQHLAPGGCDAPTS